MRRAVIACGLVMASAFFGGAARADEAAVPVQLAYDAHPGCPDAVYFYWGTAERTNRVRPARPGEAAVSVGVAIKQENGRSVGSLVVRGPGVADVHRVVEAKSCTDVVHAMALVLALAFDPDAASAAPESPVTPAVAPIAPVVRRERVFVPAPREDRVAMGLEGALASGIGPSWRPLGGVFVGYQSLRGRFVRPGAELALLLAPDRDYDGASGKVTLGFLGGRLSVCPVGLPFAGKLEFMPCVALTVGELVGEGDPGLPIQHLERRFWSAVSARGELRWDATERLFLQAGAGIGATLVRAEFVLDGARAYKVPAFSGEFAFGAGLHFR